jgi:hypothetical protein
MPTAAAPSGRTEKGAGSLNHEDGEHRVQRDGDRAAHAQPGRHDDVLPAPSEPTERRPGDQQHLEDGQAAERHALVLQQRIFTLIPSLFFGMAVLANASRPWGIAEETRSDENG